MSSTAYLAEYLGSFFFILAILMSGGNALVIGGALAVTVVLIGGISGAHVNPAVSVAQYLQGSLRPVDLLTFVFVQFLGGASAFYAYQMAR
jgi:aquaporin Z